MESKVTVYITTKNRVDLLKRALISVQKQTYRDLEIIVVNDASVDETQSYLSEEALNDARIILVNNQLSMGACHSRNLAINIATGQYITGLDDDDFYLPNRIESLLVSYKPEFSFVCDNAYALKNDSSFKKETMQSGLIDLPVILNGNIGNQVFTEVYKLREIGGFDVNLTSGQDYDVWVRLIEAFGPAQKLPQYTYVYDIIHGGGRVSTSERSLQGALMFYKKHYSKMSKVNKRHQLIRLLTYGAKIKLTEHISIFFSKNMFKYTRVMLRRLYYALAA